MGQDSTGNGSTQIAVPRKIRQQRKYNLRKYSLGVAVIVERPHLKLDHILKEI